MRSRLALIPDPSPTALGEGRGRGVTSYALGRGVGPSAPPVPYLPMDEATVDAPAVSGSTPPAPRKIERLRDLTPMPWKSGLAAWLGWLFDGLDGYLSGVPGRTSSC